MSGLVSSSSSQSSQTTQYSGLQIQTSAYGKCVPLVYGQTRVAGNLVWYGDFSSQQSSSSGSSGKGGGGGGGKSGSTGSYSYSASFALALTEGPVFGVRTVWYDKNVTTPSALGLSVFQGTYPQSAWSWLTANHGGSGVQTTIPLTAPYQLQIGDGATGFVDQGVTGALPAAIFTQESGAPGEGQYRIQQLSASQLQYIFNLADAGRTVVIRTSLTSWTGAIPASCSVVMSAQAAIANRQVYAPASGSYAPATGSPGPGQYSVSDTGLYSFNAADAGSAVTISYSAPDSSAAFQALGYSGTTYVAASNYALGGSPQLPAFNFEVQGRCWSTANGGTPGYIDSDPMLVLQDLLTNPHYGVGFPSNFIGNLTGWQSWCRANGLWISPAYTDQAQASSMLTDLATFTMSDFVWSSGQLTLVPYGNASASGNGVTWTFPTAPLFDLDDTDFLPNTNATGSSTSMNDDPVLLTRTRQADAYNSIKLEYLDRDNDYNTAVIEAQDQAAIDSYGLRADSTQTAHLFCDPNAAQTSAQLLLQRQYVRNTYQFTLDQRYIVLDPMDIVAITDPRLGLSQQWVRILEITENDDASLSISAEEVLGGQGQPPLYGAQTHNGARTNYNADPGPVNPPVIFEPAAQLAEDLEVWLALSGGSAYGGCDIWISGDGSSYLYAGRAPGNARMGVLATPLPQVAAAASGQTIDITDILSVDLSESAGVLSSGTQSDATSLNTLCYADGEFLAYETAQLVSGSLYNLSYLVRGAYGSAIGYHGAGASFVRIDSAIFKIPYTADRIGSTMYLKFLPFNIYGGGEYSLDQVEAYAYQLKGLAYASPPPDVTNLTTSYVNSVVNLNWQTVEDFRTVQYEIRKGATWAGAQMLGRVSQPPFAISGNDTYWVGVTVNPLPGLQVYSEDPPEIIVTGAAIVSNVIASYNEGGTGWGGTLSGAVAVVGGQIRTIGTANMLAVANVLGTADVINSGGNGAGIYQIPASHQIQIGRAASCKILIDWVSAGENIADNILSSVDILPNSDLLDAAASAYVDIYPEIALSQDGVTWGAWQKYAPGQYLAQGFTARMQIASLDPSFIGLLESFVFAVDVPDRDDHYMNVAIASSGTTIAFTPDGSTTATPFNGGPNGASGPAVDVTILNAQSGDTAVISSLTLSGCKVQILNGGAGVARTVNILAEGY